MRGAMREEREADNRLLEVLRRHYRRYRPPSLLERALARLRLAQLLVIAQSVPEAIQALRRDLGERGMTAADRITETVEGGVAADPATPVLLYAHYMRSGRVTPMIYRQLAAYAGLGFAIVFVTMSPRIDPADMVRLRSCCALIVRRRSFGRDFGAWADLWPEVRRRFPATAEILLANDSVLGPIKPLHTLFGRLRERDGMIGLTESFERLPHLQSYFLLLRGRTAITAADEFFAGLALTADKRKMIRRGELGIARHMSARGIPMLTAFPYETLETLALRDPLSRAVLVVKMGGLLPGHRAAEVPEILVDDLYRARLLFFRQALNPTHFMWSALVRLMDFPFIKTELLAVNPADIPDVVDWRSVVPRNSPTPVAEIEDHIAELTRPAPLDGRTPP